MVCSLEMFEESGGMKNITMKELRESEDMIYNKARFGNPPLAVGNIVWVIGCDKTGIFEMPVRIIAEREE